MFNRKMLLKVFFTGFATMGLFLLCQESAFAAKGLADLSKDISGEVKTVSQLLIIVSYVAGIGFVLAGIVQFKAHKDNPTQVPLSKPMVYLVVGACLLFLPSVAGSAGVTIFGGDAENNKSGEFEADSSNVVGT